MKATDLGPYCWALIALAADDSHLAFYIVLCYDQLRVSIRDRGYFGMFMQKYGNKSAKVHAKLHNYRALQWLKVTGSGQDWRGALCEAVRIADMAMIEYLHEDSGVKCQDVHMSTSIVSGVAKRLEVVRYLHQVGGVKCNQGHITEAIRTGHNSPSIALELIRYLHQVGGVECNQDHISDVIASNYSLSIALELVRYLHQVGGAECNQEHISDVILFDYGPITLGLVRYLHHVGGAECNQDHISGAMDMVNISRTTLKLVRYLHEFGGVECTPDHLRKAMNTAERPFGLQLTRYLHETAGVQCTVSLEEILCVNMQVLKYSVDTGILDVSASLDFCAATGRVYALESLHTVANDEFLAWAWDFQPHFALPVLKYMYTVMELTLSRSDMKRWVAGHFNRPAIIEYIEGGKPWLQRVFKLFWW